MQNAVYIIHNVDTRIRILKPGFPFRYILRYIPFRSHNRRKYAVTANIEGNNFDIKTWTLSPGTVKLIAPFSSFAHIPSCISTLTRIFVRLSSQIAFPYVFNPFWFRAHESNDKWYVCCLMHDEEAERTKKYTLYTLHTKNIVCHIVNFPLIDAWNIR